MIKFKLMAWGRKSGLMEITPLDADRNWLGGTSNSFDSKEKAIDAYNSAQLINLTGKDVPDGFKRGPQEKHILSGYEVMIVEVIE